MATITRTTTTVTRTTTEPMVRRSSARGWLKTLGFGLLILGILGLVPTVRSLGHDVGFHLEGGNDVLHWALGIVVLVVAFALRNALHLAVAAICAGVALLAIALVGALTPTLGGWHVGLGDNVLHLLLGLITLLVGIVSLNRERDAANRASRPVVRTTY